tara:strand:- start:107 stop:781 length:675 start_codon:yes stop_codon:yes gene_type:complete
MIFSALYYLASTALFSAGAFGVYYWIDQSGAQSLMAKATWYGMRTYIQASEYFTEDEKNSDTEEDDDEEKSDDKYIHYTLDPEEALVTSFVNERTREDIKKNHITNLEMVSTKINGNEYFKIIDTDTVLTDIDYLPVEKQFIQVELEQNNKKICIHENLEKFYLADNKLFTKPWLQWYLTKYYGERLEEDYTLHIIDSSVNLFKINEKEFIFLTKQSYETHKLE